MPFHFEKSARELHCGATRLREQSWRGRNLAEQQQQQQQHLQVVEVEVEVEAVQVEELEVEVEEEEEDFTTTKLN